MAVIPEFIIYAPTVLCGQQGDPFTSWLTLLTVTGNNGPTGAGPFHFGPMNQLYNGEIVDVYYNWYGGFYQPGQGSFDPTYLNQNGTYEWANQTYDTAGKVRLDPSGFPYRIYGLFASSIGCYWSGGSVNTYTTPFQYAVNYGNWFKMGPFNSAILGGTGGTSLDLPNFTRVPYNFGLGCATDQNDNFGVILNVQGQFIWDSVPPVGTNLSQLTASSASGAALPAPIPSFAPISVKYAPATGNGNSPPTPVEWQSLTGDVILDFAYSTPLPYANKIPPIHGFYIQYIGHIVVSSLTPNYHIADALTAVIAQGGFTAAGQFNNGNILVPPGDNQTPSQDWEITDLYVFGPPEGKGVFPQVTIEWAPTWDPLVDYSLDYSDNLGIVFGGGIVVSYGGQIYASGNQKSWLWAPNTDANGNVLPPYVMIPPTKGLTPDSDPAWTLQAWANNPTLQTTDTIMDVTSTQSSGYTPFEIVGETTQNIVLVYPPLVVHSFGFALAFAFMLLELLNLYMFPTLSF
jgi:hypothetical protein